MAKTYFYLRPSADISVGHTLYPEGSTNAYSLINEEVCDGSATYIMCKAVAGQTVTNTSSFKMSGIMPSDARCITDAKVFLIDTSSAATVNASVTVTVNGTSFVLEKMEDNSYYSQSFIDAMKKYNSSTEIIISITHSITTSSDSKIYLNAYCSQAYIKLCYHNGVHRKVNGEWKNSNAVYQKINGIWEQIENGYETVGSRLSKMGHHQTYLPAVSKTCFENGLTEGYKCSICGEALHKQETIPASHEYVKYGQYNICSVCSNIENMGRIIFPLKNYSEIEPLSYAKLFQSGCVTLGNYAMFAGSYQDNDDGITNYKNIDTYDISFTKIMPADLSNTGEHISTILGNYAMFSCDWTPDTGVIDVYDTSLIKTTPTSYVKSSGTAATTVGNYAIFGGGYSIGESTPTYLDIANAYNTSFTKISLTPLSEPRGRSGSAALGDYAIFLFGYADNGWSDKIDVYNKSLTKVECTNTVSGYSDITGATVGNHAIFAVEDTCHYYIVDTSLTVSSIYSDGNYLPDRCNAATLISHILFNGSNRIISFDTSLTINNQAVEFARPYIEGDSNGMDGVGMTTLNGYVLFAGGHYTYGTNPEYCYNNVYAYKLYE